MSLLATPHADIHVAARSRGDRPPRWHAIHGQFATLAWANFHFALTSGSHIDAAEPLHGARGDLR